MTSLAIADHSPTPAELAPVTGVPAERNPYWVYTNGLDSPQSRRVQRECLDRLAWLVLDDLPSDLEHAGATVPWWLLRYPHTAALRALLLEQITPPRQPGGRARPWSPSYINQHITALRRVLEVSWDLQLIDTDTYMRARKITSVKGTRELAGRHLAAGEIHGLLRACVADDGLATLRDAAAIAILHSTGVRVAELAGAGRCDYSPGDRTLAIIGKGNKQRTAHIHEDAARYIDRWLSATPQITGPIICPVNRYGTAVDRHLTTKPIEDLLEKRRLKAGLVDLSPHDFRRTLTSNLLEMGVDLNTVKEIIGHASVVTTAMYDRRKDKERGAIIDRLALPQPAELLAA